MMRIEELGQNELEKVGRAIHAQIRVTYRVPGGDQEALVNDVWVKLLEDDQRRLGLFDPNKSSLLTYIRTIAKHVAIDQLRKEVGSKPKGKVEDSGNGEEKRHIRIFVRPEDVPELTAPDPDPSSGIVARKELAELDKFMKARLSNREYVFFRLHRIDGCDYDECERTLRCTRAVLFNMNSKINRLAAEYQSRQEASTQTEPSERPPPHGGDLN